MNYLAHYQTHNSIEEMNASVKAHIAQARLTGNARKVLQCLAKHSLKYIGACKLKGITIAAELGISRSTVTRVMKQLKDLHIIEVHSCTKLNGIKGANIYTLTAFSPNEPSSEPTGVTHRANTENPCDSEALPENTKQESLAFNLSFNTFVDNNVRAYVPMLDTKQVLKNIYQPTTSAQNETFEELCKIAFGRLKQFMQSHSIPYLQMEQIIIRCLRQLVVKKGVRNLFALYSKMIERQVLQLFEQPIRPDMQSTSREVIPDWFYARNESKVMTEVKGSNFEAERAIVLKKLEGLWGE